jgi:hypothetical protein
LAKTAKRRRSGSRTKARNQLIALSQILSRGA